MRLRSPLSTVPAEILSRRFRNAHHHGFCPQQRENLCFVTPPGVKGQAASGSNREGESTDAERRGGAARNALHSFLVHLDKP